jgi:hypothetical protein
MVHEVCWRVGLGHCVSCVKERFKHPIRARLMCAQACITKKRTRVKKTRRHPGRGCTGVPAQPNTTPTQSTSVPFISLSLLCTAVCALPGLPFLNPRTLFISQFPPSNATSLPRCVHTRTTLLPVLAFELFFRTFSASHPVTIVVTYNALSCPLFRSRACSISSARASCLSLARSLFLFLSFNPC